jgi:hypothetical protein
MHNSYASHKAMQIPNITFDIGCHINWDLQIGHSSIGLIIWYHLNLFLSGHIMAFLRQNM